MMFVKLFHIFYLTDTVLTFTSKLLDDWDALSPKILKCLSLKNNFYLRETEILVKNRLTKYETMIDLPPIFLYTVESLNVYREGKFCKLELCVLFSVNRK